MAVDAVALLDGLQGAGVFGQQRLATAHAGGRDGAVEVFPHRPGEFRLAAVGPDDGHVRADACKGRIENGSLYTGAQGFLAKGRLPAGEALGRLLESSSTGGADGCRGQADGGALHDGCRGVDLARGMVVGTGGQQAQAGAEKGAAQQGWVKHVHVSKACVRALTLTCRGCGLAVDEGLRRLSVGVEMKKPPSGRLRGGSCLCLCPVVPGGSGTAVG